MTTPHYEHGFELEYEDEHQIGQTGQSNSVVPKKPKLSLSSLLRTVGACAVIASLSLFLIEGWADGNDLNRYIKLLAQTGLITGAGIFLSFIVKEVKGARVFFGLGLVSAVANFTILGALTYSIFQLDEALGNYPSMLQWQAINFGELLPLGAAAIVLLALLSRFSFGIFARPVAAKLTLSFLGLNALLLIPAREAMYVSAMATIALLAATRITLTFIQNKELLLTPEAKCAIATLFLPGLIIISRALGLYAVNDLLLLTIFAILYYAFRQIGSVTNLIQESAVQISLAWAQYLSGFMMACLFAGLIPAQIEDTTFFVFSSAMLVLTFDQAKSNAHLSKKSVQSWITMTALMVLAFNAISLLTITSLGVAALSVLSTLSLLALVHLSATFAPDLRGNKALAIVGVAVASISTVTRLISLLDVGSWVLIGGLGIGLILLASLYERFGATLKFPPQNT